jgi:ATP-binding cassette subfamily B (MDR/TAP) protein 1
MYSKSLEEPLRNASRKTVWSNLMYALSQSFAFFTIALVFWYGSRLVSFQEFTSKQFFTGLMVSWKGHQDYCVLTFGVI